MGLSATPETPVLKFEELEPKNNLLIEPLKPNEIFQFLIDIDYSILDNVAAETPERVAIKVALLNQSFLELAQRTNKQVLVTLMTKKPATVFTHEDTKALYAPLLEIKSVRKGLIKTKLSDDVNSPIERENCWVTMALPHAGTELGTVTRVSDPLTPDSPTLIVDENFGQAREKIIELETILNDHLIFKDENQEYQLEPGNLIYVAVQKLGGKPMSPAEKEKVFKQIQTILVDLHRTDLLDLFEFSLNGNDVDISLPNIKTGKLIGVQADIDSKQYQGYDHKWYKKCQVICDDSWKDTGQAAEQVLKNGGSAITFANGDPQLKALIGRSKKGFVSKHRSFLGLLDGINWLATGHKLPYEKVENTNRRLKTAEIIRAFKDTVEVSLKSTGLFSIINFLSPPIPTSNIEANRNIINFVVPFLDFFFKGWFEWYPKSEKFRDIKTESVKSAMIAINPVLTSIILNSGWRPEIQVAAMAGLLISNTVAFYLLRRQEQLVAEKD